MKTAISVPDPVFEAADDLAKQLGMSRSQLYTTAVSQFLEAHQDEAITQALNEVYAEAEAAVDPILMQMQLAALPEEEW
jgi:predicted transcriptional regulator